MKSVSGVAIFVILFVVIGDAFFRDLFQSIWLWVTILFCIFLIVHGWMDKKGMFRPKDKHDKEG